MQRVLRSPTLSTWSSFLVRSLTLMAVIPLALRRLSPEEGVVWQAFSTLTMILSMADFGLTPTFVRLLSYAHGQGDATRGALLERAMSWLQTRMGWIGGACLLVFGTALLARPISRCADPTAGWIAWGGVFLGSVVLYRSSLYGAYLQGRQQIAAWRWLEMVAALGGIACTLAALFLKGDIVTLSLAGQVPGLVMFLVGRKLAKRPVASELVDNLQVRQAVREAWGPSWRSGLGVLMSQGLFLASPLVFAQIAPAASVASYMVAARLMSAVSQFSQAPFYSKIPHMASLYGQRRGKELLEISKSAMTKSLMVFVVGAVLAGLAYPILLKSWGSQTSFVQYWVWGVLLLATLLERVGAMQLQFHSLSNVIRWHIANGGGAMIFLLFVFTLGRQFGVEAIPMALLGANLLFYLPFSTVLGLGVRRNIQNWPTKQGVL